MSEWRVVITDTERPTGIAPTCEQDHYEAHVEDCCPGPHVECWDEGVAERLAKALTEAEAEVCS